MKKILGLDFGDKRIGAAIAEKNLVASYGVIDNENLQEAINEIGRICRAEQVGKIVVGLPQKHANRVAKDTYQLDKIHLFAHELSKNLQIPIDFVDETLTSKEAERLLAKSKNKKSKKFKEEIDKISAKLILEQYLEKRSKV